MRNKTIARVDCNKPKTHPRWTRKFMRSPVDRRGESFLHAEMAGLIGSRPGDIICVTRLNANGSLTTSKPCPHCLLAMWEAKISEVHYTDENGIWRIINLKKLSFNDIKEEFMKNPNRYGLPARWVS